eukprot:CAMPEP_0177317914 /NCGR_PEP_ID=MMETSP0368-20130122/13791_1 /TAXON_ID=447022 ORGANISM="Scrippsiella hangoei-like, Strain SHHI-4" /NCGR_SAMPLE_ID=MMETSP0368 /ASSEMBLY_ACC=CAM_ASM_000363 /LENGTH=173 /DNA_ID=CAMNT_0018777301 /DNA_START=71 /DNA_END=592 /DNA_ORIENTATION=-
MVRSVAVALVFSGACALLLPSAFVPGKAPSRTAAPATRFRDVQTGSAAVSGAAVEPSPSVAPVAASLVVVLGLFAGLFAGPQVVSAGGSQALPTFQLSSTQGMQGIDASNATTEKGQMDFVTRCRIEAQAFLEGVKEFKVDEAIRRDAPAKEEQAGMAQQQIDEYAKTAQIPK